MGHLSLTYNNYTLNIILILIYYQYKIYYNQLHHLTYKFLYNYDKNQILLIQVIITKSVYTNDFFVKIFYINNSSKLSLINIYKFLNKKHFTYKLIIEVLLTTFFRRVERQSF